MKLSSATRQKLGELRDYLQYDLKLSDTAVDRYWLRISSFLKTLQNDADYALCRFKRWRELDYRCVPFENKWVFAYEIFDEGVLIQDMASVATLKN